MESKVCRLCPRPLRKWLFRVTLVVVVGYLLLMIGGYQGSIGRLFSRSSNSSSSSSSSSSRPVKASVMNSFRLVRKEPKPPRKKSDAKHNDTHSHQEAKNKDQQANLHRGKGPDKNSIGKHSLDSKKDGPKNSEKHSGKGSGSPGKHSPDSGRPKSDKQSGKGSDSFGIKNLGSQKDRPKPDRQSGKGSDNPEEGDLDPHSDRKKNKGEAHSVCPDVLTDMLDGEWVKRDDVTEPERKDVMKYYRKFKRTLPPNDKRCANITDSIQWRRALCDEESAFPCCMNNVCVNRTAAECTCKTCVDQRHAVVAELSRWKAKKKKCNLPPLPESEICRLLNGSRITLMGDSLMRNIVVGFLMYIRQNDKTGALQPRFAKDAAENCTGIWTFDKDQCLNKVDYKGTVCDGVQIVYRENYRVLHNVSIIDGIYTSGRQSIKRSIHVFNMGIWEYYYHDKVIKHVLDPLVQKLRMDNLPPYRLLWLSSKAPGLLKPLNGHQSRQDVLNYNNRVNKLMQEWAVPVLDVFKMTDGVRSRDGTHHALAVNKLIAHTFFHYLLQLERQGLW